MRSERELELKQPLSHCGKDKFNGILTSSGQVILNTLMAVGTVQQ
jgi:hypothetical protein